MHDTHCLAIITVESSKICGKNRKVKVVSNINVIQ